MSSILIKPIVTEKMMAEGEKHRRYGFKVRKEANKQQIKKVVEELYDVKVVRVNTMIYGGKKRDRFTKRGIIKGRTSAYKKAIITLAEGNNIDFYSNI
ncbi:MAG: 50S ribosomal protein L23 [Bacteroidales bacterium]|jgi:large subunit ribosomal protein L23|nr:50S ribosomal protein L23 [Bacteroidales bacterium]